MTKAAHQLRFPEFRARPPWRTSTLGEVFSRITNGKANAEDHEEGGTYPLFDRSEVVKASNQFVFDAESVIIPGEGVRFQPRYFVGRFNLHQRAYALMECSGRARFFFHQLDHLKGLLATSAVKSTVLSLRLPIIEGFPVRSPEPDEQQKIADCLTSLDEVIASQGRKVEALKTQKKGLMQHLFPQKGQTLPRLRFPEFRDAPEWESEPLGQLTTIVRGGSPRPIDGYITSDPDGLNWLKIGDVDKEAKYVTRTADRVRPEALSMTRVIRPGDFILSNSMSFGRPYISQIETCIHDGWIAVTDVPDDLDRDFLYYAISAEHSQGFFVDRAAGGGVQNLNTEIVKLLPVLRPVMAEQLRIADCLASLDAAIAAAAGVLAALKTHKAGLMQGLFPAAEPA